MSECESDCDSCCSVEINDQVHNLNLLSIKENFSMQNPKKGLSKDNFKIEPYSNKTQQFDPMSVAAGLDLDQLNKLDF